MTERNPLFDRAVIDAIHAMERKRQAELVENKLATVYGGMAPIERTNVLAKGLGSYGDLLDWTARRMNALSGWIGERPTPKNQLFSSALGSIAREASDAGGAFRDWSHGFAPIRSTPEGGYTHPRVDREQLFNVVSGGLLAADIAKNSFRATRDAAKEFAEASGKGVARMAPSSENMKVRLYRAADDDLVVDSASFSSDVDAAREYLNNPGFGGRDLYRADVEIDPDRFLDLSEMDADGAVETLMRQTGREHPGAIGPDEWIPRISYDLRDSGIDWVRVKESYPVESDTYIWVGGDEPPMKRLK